MTFKELEELTDYCTSYLGVENNTFYNQAAELENFSASIKKQQENLDNIHFKINMIKTFQNLLDKDLEYIGSCQEKLDTLLCLVEKQMNICEDENQKSDYRQDTYKSLETISSFVTNIKHLMEEVEKISESCKISSENMPIPQIAQVMQHHLQQLEIINLRIQKLQNNLNKTLIIKQNLLKKLNLKEVTEL